jgi:hypothetical protein
VATSLSQDGGHVDPAATARNLAGEDMPAVAIRLADAADLAYLIVEEEEEGNEWLAKDVLTSVNLSVQYPNISIEDGYLYR